ncbi:MAG: DNA repair protein RecN [Victivallaceae bacterium]|nr:DNA repair protein RecN [Victivallaceae bacterium]
MLNWLKIKNLALIAAADVEFGGGLNVITGETGAGKSVLLSVITLLLGARADKSCIRSGEDRCEISAGISINDTVLIQMLPELESCGVEFDRAEPEIQLRRVITRTQNRNFINDTPVTLETLQKIGTCLVDVHAANEHHSLFNRAYQLDLLDRYAKLEPELQACAAICAELRALNARREELFAGMPSALEAEHLQMSVDEINRVNPQPDEDTELYGRHALAADSLKIIELSAAIVQQLNESENSIADQMGTIYRNIQEMLRNSPKSESEMLQLCSTINESLRELSSSVEIFSDRAEMDEEGFAELESRMSALETLKRRFGPTLEQVFDVLNEAEQRLKTHRDADQLRKDLDKEELTLKTKLLQESELLSDKRRAAAKKLTVGVVGKLEKLGFLRSSLDLQFSRVEPGERGFDQVEMLFSANPGEALQPLRAIASSGELSRVMLALKTVLADADAVPVLLFDEIDVNIGGETASQVGAELNALAKRRQVLCISHLPRVAACADRHYAVCKEVTDGRTFSRIVLLDNQARATELSRMLGGGKAALVLAQDLLNK